MESLRGERQEEAIETREWLDSLDYVLVHSGPERAVELLGQLQSHARRRGVDIPLTANTPYINTIPPDQQSKYPGRYDLERRLRNIIRWNAMIMVARANHEDPTMGGHIATYASAATVYEVAFNHFLRGRTEDFEGDQVFFQAHTAPGVYARAFLEGRLSEEQLINFRHELRPEGGLSSYPHPRLMPDFWQFPSASMGLSSIMAIYQARYNRYLEDRGLKAPSDAKVWAFIGDGEMDEPESLGAISLAARERLDSLIFVINCNLQRLDGPVRGNGKIIQELETMFRGAGWNVIKVVWGSGWDPLLAMDEHGLLVRRMGEIVDGQYQKYTVSSGAYCREHFFGTDPRLLELSRQLTDEQIRTIRRGGHDPDKVYAAFKAATEFRGVPSVVLAKTIKGYGMGPLGEGTMATHQLKKLPLDVLNAMAKRLGIPYSATEVEKLPFYKPSEDDAVIRYLKERRQALGGFVPQRMVPATLTPRPSDGLFNEFTTGTESRAMSTTMVVVRIASKLLQDPGIGRYIVPIVADEARTFGMVGLFKLCGIYSHLGQLYEPKDAGTPTHYREARDGQLIEEGISEAGALSTFIAAGTAYATHGVPTLPFFIFYSMFGFQRVGDLIWAAGDQQARGFLIGATSGRTTLNGEGLQHQDGHSHITAYGYPHVVAYDPAFDYELAVIIREGVRRMHVEGEPVIYYLTVTNENYAMPSMPDGAEEGILKGLYKVRPSQHSRHRKVAHLFGSGAILNETMRAQTILEEDYGVAADVWSVTSFKQLHEDGNEVEHWNLLHPDEPSRVPWVTQCLAGESGAFVVASDYVKALPNSVARWFPRPPVALGTDGFGRSESRAALRRFFEVNAETIVYAALVDLARQEEMDADTIRLARRRLGVETEKANPLPA